MIMKTKAIYYISILFTMLLASHSDVLASNKVKIATIGGGGGLVNAGDNRDPQALVVQIIDYWKGELDKVLPYHPDLILLTEACDRPGGLTTEEQFNYYKIRKNQVLDYFASVARANRCYFAFGMKREENGGWRNSCVLLDREGKISGMYDKNFPTIDEMEQGIKAGNSTPLLKCDFGTIGCAICFDLNFDELRQKYEALKPDIMIFPSMYHGGLEQSKWAYSCRSFFVCSFGSLTAPSEIRNPLGEVVATSTNYFNYAVATINLDRSLVHLDYNWEKLVALKKKYGDDVIISDPGKLGVVMITSENSKISAADMVKEFNIETVDDYFSRVRVRRNKQLNIN